MDVGYTLKNVNIGMKHRIRRLLKFKWIDHILFRNEISLKHRLKINLSHEGLGTIINKHVKIGNNVKISNNVIIGGHKFKHPIIEDDVIINAYSIIIGGVTIGQGSIIGIGTFVNKDIPPNSIVYNKKELIIRERDS